MKRGRAGAPQSARQATPWSARVLELPCGRAGISPDGSAVSFQAVSTAEVRSFEERTWYRGRQIALLAGEAAEIALLGRSEVSADCRWVDMILKLPANTPAEERAAPPEHLQCTAASMVLRHVGKSDRLGREPWHRGSERVRCIFALVACGWMACSNSACGSVPRSARSDLEAARLFAVVLARLPTPGRCGIDSDWSGEPVPDYVDHSVFRYSLRAGLIPPSAKGDLRSIIDPYRRLPTDAFCSDNELKVYAAQRVADFEKGSEKSMQIDRIAFGYPIFDKARRTAVVVVTRLALEGRARREGKIGRNPAGVGTEVEIFRRPGGRWRFVRSVVTGIS